MGAGPLRIYRKNLRYIRNGARNKLPHISNCSGAKKDLTRKEFAERRDEHYWRKS